MTAKPRKVVGCGALVRATDPANRRAVERVVRALYNTSPIKDGWGEPVPWSKAKDMKRADGETWGGLFRRAARAAMTAQREAK